MSFSAERVMLATKNLGSRENLNRLTREIETMTAELRESDYRWSLGDLRRFQQMLEFTNRVIGRLRHTVRSQIGAIAGEQIDAG